MDFILDDAHYKIKIMHQSWSLSCDKGTIVTRDVNSRGDGVRVHHSTAYHICNFPINLKPRQNKSYAKLHRAALFTRAEAKKQPKCLSIEEWIKTWYIYTTCIRNTVCAVLSQPAVCDPRVYGIPCVHHGMPCVLCSVSQPCATLCDPMDCCPPGSSVRGIFQARILEWVAISSSRGSFPPRD